MKNREVERKWVLGGPSFMCKSAVEQLVSLCSSLKTEYIHQVILAVDDNKMLRVRCYADSDGVRRYDLTLKIADKITPEMGKALDRLEFNWDLSESDGSKLFEALQSGCGEMFGSLKKLRVYIDKNVTIDIFMGDLEGIVMIEKEYDVDSSENDSDEITEESTGDMITGLRASLDAKGIPTSVSYNATDLYSFLFSMYNQGRIREVTHDPIYINQNLCRSVIRECFGGQKVIVKR